MDKSVQTPEKPQNGLFLSKAFEIVAYPFSAVVGLFVAQKNIRDYAYDNAKNMEAVHDITVPHRDRLRGIGRRANMEISAGREFDLIAATREEFRHHPSNVQEGLKKLGIGTFPRQLTFTSSHQKQKAVLEGFGAAAISIGALLLVAESKIFKDFCEPPSADKQAGR